MNDIAVDILKQIMEHDAGYSVNLQERLFIYRPFNHNGKFKVEYEQSTEDYVPKDCYASFVENGYRYVYYLFDDVEDAIRFFLEKRSELGIGLDYESDNSL